MITRRSFIILLTLGLVTLAGCGTRSVELVLVAPDLAMDRDVAETLARYVGEESGIRIRLVPRPDGQTPVEAVASGHADLAFAANLQTYRPDITTIMPVYPTVLHFLVRDDRASTKFEEMFSGARIYGGNEGAASLEVVTRLLDFFGVSVDQVTFVGQEARDQADIVVVYAPVLPNQVPELEGFRLVSFGRPDDIGHGGLLDRATLFNPYMRPFIIPVGTYGNLTPEPVATVAVDKLLVARPDLDEAVAYDLVAEVLRLRPALASARPSVLGNLDDDFGDGHFSFSLHPGSRAYVDRDEPTWVERYSGVAEVLVTLFVASISGLIAVINVYRIRRKNRIDRFYGEVFAIREAVSKTASAEERAAAIRSLKQLQKRAYDMLVDEKLAADNSFQIFISLSNDAIREMSDRK